MLAPYSNTQSGAAVPLKLDESFLPINTYPLTAEKERSLQTSLQRMNACDGVTFTNHSAQQNDIIKLATGRSHNTQQLAVCVCFRSIIDFSILAANYCMVL